MPAKKKDSVSKGVVQDGPGEDGNSLCPKLEEKLKLEEGEEIKEEAKEIKEEAKEIKEGEGIEKLSMLDIMKGLKNLPKSELRKVFNSLKIMLNPPSNCTECGKSLQQKFIDRGLCALCLKGKKCPCGKMIYGDQKYKEKGLCCTCTERELRGLPQLVLEVKD